MIRAGRLLPLAWTLGLAVGVFYQPHSSLVADKIVAGARAQLNWGTKYDASYVRIKYPGGDISRSQGVCTDVLVRAFRNAGYDLQKLIHEDKLKAAGDYPKYPGQKGADSNIDHRRVPNQMAFFRRHGLTLTKTISQATLGQWKPGDVVFWKLDNGLDHTGILTDKRNRNGQPYVVHNLSTPLEEDCLVTWQITGHFRYPK